jgi:K+-sensing histidine kinase KdpD
MKLSEVARLSDRDRDELLVTTRQLLAEMQALSSRIAAVQEIATAINRTLDLDEILAIVGRQAKWLLDFEHCSVTLSEAESSQFMTLFGPDISRDRLRTAANDPVATAVATKQSQLIRHKLSPDSFYASLIIIPLESENEVLGTINFATSKTEAYTQDDLRIGYLLALQLSSAIRNAHRFEEINKLYSQLETTYGDLRQSEQMRDDMTHMIVHDLRNPLSVMMLTVDMVSKKGEIANQSFVQLLDNAYGAGHRLMGMIDDMLDVSKLEAGELKLVRAPLEWDELLTDRVKEYVFQAEKGKKQFHLALAPDLPVARGDGRLIGRVLDNLFSNAVKYTVRGGAIQLSITADEQQLIVKMQDDGEGIPDDFLDRIFDKFTQVTDETGAARRKGTGLGLAFCRMVVEAHGGRISVTSSEGKGSTFTFTLPL